VVRFTATGNSRLMLECERFTSSQAPVAAYSPISSSDTRQLPLLNGMPTAARSCEKEPQRDGSPTCECTRETFGCSIHPNTPAAWIASQRASLARTLATPAIAQASRKVREAGSGPRSSALLASFDPATCSLKTSQQSWGWDSTPCSPILPSWGSMLAGAVYELPMLVRPTDEIDGGSMATPTSKANQLSPSMAKHPGCVAWWPTPKSHAGSNRRTKPTPAQMRGEAGMDLAVAARMWPTPDTNQRGGPQHPDKRKAGGHSVTLQDAVLGRTIWPTPRSNEWKRMGAKGTPSSLLMASKHYLCAVVNEVEPQATGALNPTWVEWLMGWPLGWTVSRHWATGKSRRKPPSRGES
jgi:hypothetical protein